MARIYAENQIRAIRKAKGLTMQELGLQMDPPVAIATIAKLELRQMALSLDYIMQISRILEVPPSDIIANGPVRVRHIPLVGSIPAGNWGEAVKLSDETVPIPEDAGGPRSFALRFDGDSMNLLTGDQGGGTGFGVCDPDQTDLVDGKVYAVMNELGETTVKKFQLSPPALVPMSDNPNHEAIVIGRTQFIVIGRITYAGTKL